MHKRYIILLLLLLMPALGVKKWPEPEDSGPVNGMDGNTATDATMDWWRGLKEFFPQRQLKTMYVSSEAGGDFGVGKAGGAGSKLEPLLNMTDVIREINAAGCGLDFVFDSQDTWTNAVGFINGITVSDLDLDCPDSWSDDIGLRLRASDPDFQNTITAGTGIVVTTSHNGVVFNCNSAGTDSGVIGVDGTNDGADGKSLEAWVAVENIALVGDCERDAFLVMDAGKMATLNTYVDVAPGAVSAVAHAYMTNVTGGGSGGGGALYIINGRTRHDPFASTSGTPITKLGLNQFVMLNSESDVRNYGVLDSYHTYIDGCGVSTIVNYEAHGESEIANVTNNAIRQSPTQDGQSLCDGLYAKTEVGLFGYYVRILIEGMPQTTAFSNQGNFSMRTASLETFGHRIELYGYRGVGGSGITYQPVGGTANGQGIPHELFVRSWAREKEHPDRDGEGHVFHNTTTMGTCDSDGSGCTKVTTTCPSSGICVDDPAFMVDIDWTSVDMDDLSTTVVIGNNSSKFLCTSEGANSVESEGRMPDHWKFFSNGECTLDPGTAYTQGAIGYDEGTVGVAAVYYDTDNVVGGTDWSSTFRAAPSSLAKGGLSSLSEAERTFTVPLGWGMPAFTTGTEPAMQYRFTLSEDIGW